MRSDETLAQAAARDDHAAFMALYDRYAVRVGRYATAHISNPSDAEDVVSLVFMRALERIDQYRPERGSFAAWLFGIARNTVREHFRRGWRLTSLLPSHTPEGGPSAEDTALHHEELGAVEMAIQQLTPSQRDALALRYVAGLPHAEVGRLLGKNDEACRKLIARAIDALRRAMNEEVPQ
jgi:RNA polymerase sigma-70 factor (ECF subfamily)